MYHTVLRMIFYRSALLLLLKIIMIIIITKHDKTRLTKMFVYFFLFPHKNISGGDFL